MEQNDNTENVVGNNQGQQPEQEHVPRNLQEEFDASSILSEHVPAPTIGGVAIVDGKSTPWTGGRPQVDWVALDPTAETTYESPNQLRPTKASEAEKSYKYRCEGLKVKFSKGQKLTPFKRAIWRKLVDYGMDSIAYAIDPEDDTKVTNVVKGHSRYTNKTIKTYSQGLRDRFDAYDRENDKAATSFLRDSIDDDLLDTIDRKLDGTKPSFVVTYMELINAISSTSIERFNDLKDKIKQKHPAQYAGENLSLLAADFYKLAEELEMAGQYDHNLTLTMLDAFLKAGGENNEDFRFTLRSTKQKLNEALLEIGYKDKSSAQSYMEQKKLT